LLFLLFPSLLIFVLLSSSSSFSLSFSPFSSHFYPPLCPSLLLSILCNSFQRRRYAYEVCILSNRTVEIFSNHLYPSEQNLKNLICSINNCLRFICPVWFDKIHTTYMFRVPRRA
jgi:hypothetical protein